MFAGYTLADETNADASATAETWSWPQASVWAPLVARWS
jgi:hypothetical protein